MKKLDYQQGMSNEAFMRLVVDTINTIIDRVDSITARPRARAAQPNCECDIEYWGGHKDTCRGAR